MTVIRSRRGGQEGANLTHNDTISAGSQLLQPLLPHRFLWLLVTQHLSQSHNFPENKSQDFHNLRAIFDTFISEPQRLNISGPASTWWPVCSTTPAPQTAPLSSRAASSPSWPPRTCPQVLCRSSVWSLSRV